LPSAGPAFCGAAAGFDAAACCGFRCRGLLLRRRAGCGADLEPGDRLDARADRFGAERLRIGAVPAQHQLHQEQDADDRHHEREHDHDDQLLRSFDERFVLVVRVHWNGFCVL
jgi:hypothetical protein